MKKRLQALLLVLCMSVSMLYTGCGDASKSGTSAESGTESSTAQANAETGTTNETEDGSKNGEADLAASPMVQANSGELNVIDDNYRTDYEVFLYSFYDSDGDGVGDIPGLIDKLDYINDGDDSTDTDLGFNGIWLMPIMPSTTYHKYDVTDYEAIDEQYGTMEDFDKLVEECHKRGINVIIDFVMNHTSSKHPWFTQATDYMKGLADGATPSAEECSYFAYYNFSQQQKSGSWYQVGDTDWYYEAGFWSEMPDLNWDNPQLKQEFDDITTFWLDKGVDGFRLDAVKEIYTDQVSANVEMLSWFNDMVKAKKEDAYIVGEAWTDLATYSQYYASGIDSLFDFNFANTDGVIADAVKKTSGAGASTYGKAVASLHDTLSQYNENYIDAPFYTNHDLARSAGYYSGDDSEAQTKIAGAMNLMMSGCAFVYYGEELGMKGSGADENKRAPMQWSTDKNAAGMCDGPQGMKAIKMKYGSLEDQQDAPDSIYNFYKQAVKLRNIYPQIARGSVTFEENMSDDNICVLTKTYDDESIMIVFNISAEEQSVDVSGIELTEGSAPQIGGMLLTGDDTVTENDGTLTMPAYSIVILK